MKKLVTSFLNIITLVLCLLFLGYHLASEGKHISKAHQALKKTFSFLFVDANSNKIFDEGEPLVVMAADDYRDLFQRNVPLERMLRSQIKGMEFIVLTQDDFNAMDTNRDRMLTTADVPPYDTYDLYMTLHAPSHKQLAGVRRPAIFLYNPQVKEMWNYIISSPHRPSSPIERDTVAGKAILQVLQISDFKALRRAGDTYQPNTLQKKIIIQTILSLPNNIPLYKIYFAKARGAVDHDFITTDAKIVNLSELKSIVLEKAKMSPAAIDGNAAYFDNGLMMKIHSAKHYLNWIGL